MNCDPIARWYRWLEYAGFGRALEKRRLEFLTSLGDVRHALMLGEGDGRFLAEFLRYNSHATVDYLDLSERMLDLAKNRAGSAHRVRFHQLDAREGPPGDAYDLVVTHFFLDCFTQAELAPLVDTLAAATTPGAIWVVSEFRQPARGPAAWRAWVWLRILYAFFAVVSGLPTRRLPDHHACLTAAGFHLRQSRLANAGLLVSELWQRVP